MHWLKSSASAHVCLPVRQACRWGKSIPIRKLAAMWALSARPSRWVSFVISVSQCARLVVGESIPIRKLAAMWALSARPSRWVSFVISVYQRVLSVIPTPMGLVSYFHTIGFVHNIHSVGPVHYPYMPHFYTPYTSSTHTPYTSNTRTPDTSNTHTHTIQL